jgi:hypothetical protein
MTMTAALGSTWGVPSMLPPMPLQQSTVDSLENEKILGDFEGPVAVVDAGADTATLDDLEDALDEMYEEGLLFMGRLRVLSGMERRYGGQGIVQFANTVESKNEEFAIKFFLQRSAFARETALFSSSGVIREMMPNILAIEGNADGRHMLPGGMKAPPFIVVERGESLDEWVLRVQPDYVTVLQVSIPTIPECSWSIALTRLTGAVQNSARLQCIVGDLSFQH